MHNLQTVHLESILELKTCDNCFSEDKKINSLELSGEKITIKKKSFSNCTSISDLKVETSKTVILGDNAFEGCTNLSLISLNATDEFRAGICCFKGATYLNTAQIKSKMVQISSSSLSNCQYMKSFTILAAEETFLGDRSFENCRSITTVEVYSSEKFKADNFCFNNAASLRTVKISSKIVFFGCDCFTNCSSLKTVDSQSATQITRFRSSFNGKDYKMYLKYNPNTLIKVL